MFNCDNKYCKEIDIKMIITIYYREFTSCYAYGGESHDYWEILYVDKGELYVVSDDKAYLLMQGDIIFHRPNEFHALYATNTTAPNAVIISFDTDSPAMRFFEKKIVKIPKEKNSYIANIINEAKRAFLPELGGIHKKELRLQNPAFGSEQLMYTYLEMFLIDIYRSNFEEINIQRTSELNAEVVHAAKSVLINEIVEYMKRNLSKNLKFEDIVKEFYVGSTYLKVSFKRCLGVSVLSYFRTLKMKEAKKLIREGRYNFTEISGMLGFDTVHYFSASFKKYYDMSPSEYRNTIHVMEEAITAQMIAEAEEKSIDNGRELIKF